MSVAANTNGDRVRRAENFAHFARLAGLRAARAADLGHALSSEAMKALNALEMRAKCAQRAVTTLRTVSARLCDLSAARAVCALPVSRDKAAATIAAKQQALDLAKAAARQAEDECRDWSRLARNSTEVLFREVAAAEVVAANIAAAEVREKDCLRDVELVERRVQVAEQKLQQARSELKELSAAAVRARAKYVRVAAARQAMLAPQQSQSQSARFATWLELWRRSGGTECKNDEEPTAATKPLPFEALLMAAAAADAQD